MHDLPTGVVTFLFTDVEGSTRLVTALGDAYIAVHQRHQAVVREAIALNRGWEVSTEGDSFFAVFESASDGASAAAAIQRGLAAADWPPGSDVRVRIGVHTGQGIRGGDNYLGLDVHRAARIAAAGHGGQILLSEATHDRIAGEPGADLRLQDLGRHRLKDVGVEHLWQLEADGSDGGFGPLRTLEAHPSNLPLDLSPLIDREAEREQLRALVGTSPLVTITGPGGIGKSRLAVSVARELVPEMPDGAFYVDAAGLETAAMLADALIGLLGVREVPERRGAEALVDHLRDRSVLLVLDTLDRVQGAAALIARLASVCPRVRLLVTSRAALRVAAERELPLEPLRVVASGGLEAIAASPAVALFVARAKAVRPDFTLTATNAAAVAGICERVDGLPLAIELAAARVRLLPPEALLTRLASRLGMLTGGAADAPDRQRTLRATIDWSVHLLSAPEQRTLARLSVFGGSFDLEAAEAVIQANEDVDALEVLGRLVDQNLVVAETGGAVPRFRLLGTIREYAAESLAAGGDGPAARRAHADWFRARVLAEQAILDGPGDLAAVERIDAELDDVRTALEWWLGPEGDPVAGLELAAALGRFWWIRGRPREGRAWLERALANETAAPNAVRADARYWSGVLADEERMPAEAARRLEEALALRRELGDERGIARALNSLGVAARSMGDLARAEALFTESLERKRAVGDQRGVAATLSNLGLIAADRDRLDEARNQFEEALALDRASGEHGTEAYSLNNLGAARIWSGDVLAGAGEVRRALAVFAGLDDADGIAEATEHLGEAAAAVGAFQVAARFILVARNVRALAGAPLRGIDARRVDAALATASSALPPGDLETIRAEAAAFDASAAVALVAATDLPGEAAVAVGG